MRADLAARIPELGRHDPDEVRKVSNKHADRIFFATDFMVYDKLILGSGGDSEQPSDEDAVTFYRKCSRWLETADRDWPHMTPIQGAGRSTQSICRRPHCGRFILIMRDVCWPAFCRCRSLRRGVCYQRFCPGWSPRQP
jgi:hypothetical protein